VLHGNVCALVATKDHVNVFTYDPTVPGPAGVINQGHGNAAARAIQVYREDAIDESALPAMLRAVIVNNRAGGWRRIQAPPRKQERIKAPFRHRHCTRISYRRVPSASPTVSGKT
jgi:hypothetical protein